MFLKGLEFCTLDIIFHLCIDLYFKESGISSCITTKVSFEYFFQDDCLLSLSEISTSNLVLTPTEHKIDLETIKMHCFISPRHVLYDGPSAKLIL